MDSQIPFLGWIAIVLVWLGLVGLVQLVARYLSPNFLAKKDPEFLFVVAVLIGAVLYALISN